MPASRLAKLSRPRTDGLVPRERLFAALDAACERPVVWVAAPPGAGKTSLVSGYLEARKRPCLWYQVDSGDADVATFFYYLGLAAAQTGGRRHKPLPLFTEEYASDLEGFARIFFRGLYARLGEQAVLVLDNYQEVSESTSFQEAVRIAVDELPEGARLLALSRAEPPPALARARASQRIGFIGWDQLKLTPEETAAIAGDAGAPAISQVHELAGGWAAGVVLMLERIRQVGTLNAVSVPRSLDTIFDYFAGQVLAAAPGVAQDMLLRMAILPRLTAETAQVVTGRPDAEKLLADLARRNLFTDRRHGDQTSYQFHALFRAFLKVQAEERLGAGELRRVTHSAAALLQATGQAEDAFELFIAEGAWEAAAGVIAAEGRRLVSQGRRETLRRWTESLPWSVIDADGRLSYWAGMAIAASDAARAVERLARAFRLLGGVGDVAGAANAVIAIVDSIYASASDLHALDAWIPEIEALLNTTELRGDSDLRARVLSAFVRIIFLRRPLSPAMESESRRLEALLEEDIELPTKWYAAGVLLSYGWVLGHADRNDELITVVDRLSGVENDSDAAWRLYRYFRTIHTRHKLEFPNGPAIDDVLETSDEADISPSRIDLLRSRAGLLLLQRRFSEAYQLFQQAQPHAARMRTTMRPFHYCSFGVCALAAGDEAAVASHVRTARDALLLGTVPARLHLAPRIAGLLAAIGRADEACSFLEELKRDSDLRGSPWVFGCTEVFSAYVALKRGREQDALASLASGLAALRPVAYRAWTIFPDRDFDRLFALALEHGIEPEFVTTLIRSHGIPAPDGDLEHWPWPLRIRALGRFGVEGMPQPKAGKAQHKLNELLRAIVVRGPEGVSLHALADELWPDSEGDAALNSAQVSLYRLRKLLGREDALRVHDGVVRLERSVCWVDAWAFESKAKQALGEKDAERREALAAGALGLYRGWLLEEDEGAWMAGARQRLHRQWQTVVLAYGGWLEAGGRAREAAQVYERSLDTDAEAEAVVQRLMHCCGELGELARAAGAYERCEQALARQRGTGPSAETRKMYQRVVEAGTE